MQPAFPLQVQQEVAAAALSRHRREHHPNDSKKASHRSSSRSNKDNVNIVKQEPSPPPSSSSSSSQAPHSFSPSMPTDTSSAAQLRMAKELTAVLQTTCKRLQQETQAQKVKLAMLQRDYENEVAQRMRLEWRLEQKDAQAAKLLRFIENLTEQHKQLVAKLAESGTAGTREKGGQPLKQLQLFTTQISSTHLNLKQELLSSKEEDEDFNDSHEAEEEAARTFHKSIDNLLEMFDTDQESELSTSPRDSFYANDEEEQEEQEPEDGDENFKEKRQPQTRIMPSSSSSSSSTDTVQSIFDRMQQPQGSSVKQLLAERRKERKDSINTCLANSAPAAATRPAPSAPCQQEQRRPSVELGMGMKLTPPSRAAAEDVELGSCIIMRKCIRTYGQELEERYASSKRTTTVTYPLAGNDATEDGSTVTLSQRGSEAQRQEEAIKYQQVATELLLTERDYVRDLALIIDVFMKPMMAQQIINQQDKELLFSNLEQVHGFNSELLRRLEQEYSKPAGQQQIGHIFTDMVERFDTYTIYCANLDYARAFQNKLCQTNPAFASFLQQTQNTEQTNKLDLKSLLIKPLQRMCKYPLLLKEMLKHMKRKEEGYSGLMAASAKMHIKLTRINALLISFAQEEKEALDRTAATIRSRKQRFRRLLKAIS
ncbi:Guanine nucleotide exchange factor for Cdc42p [Balamuthia mandrillaris]